MQIELTTYRNQRKDIACVQKFYFTVLVLYVIDSTYISGITECFIHFPISAARLQAHTLQHFRPPEKKVPPPMPPHVLMNFRGFPPGCGDSAADF